MVSQQTQTHCPNCTDKAPPDPGTFEYVCFKEPDGSFSAYERTTGSRATGRSYREALGHLVANFQTGFTFEYQKESQNIWCCRINGHDIVRGTAGSKLESIGDMMIHLAKYDLIKFDVNLDYV